MLVYEKFVNGSRKLFGTLGIVPADTDKELVYLGVEKNPIELVANDSYVEGTVDYSMKRTKIDSKQVDVYIDTDDVYVNIIPGTEEPVPKAVLDSITIIQNPTKQVYNVDEAVDGTGLKIKAVFKDSKQQTTEQEIIYDDSTKNRFTFNPNVFTVDDAGKSKDIEVSYTAGSITKTATSKITVQVNRKLKSLTVTGQKVNYNSAFDGGKLTLEGATIKAEFYGLTDPVPIEPSATGFSCVPKIGDPLPNGSSTVTISYTENGVTESVAYSVSVTDVFTYYYGTTTAIPTKLSDLTAQPEVSKSQLLTQNSIVKNEQFNELRYISIAMPKFKSSEEASAKPDLKINYLWYNDDTTFNNWSPSNIAVVTDEEHPEYLIEYITTQQKYTDRTKLDFKFKIS